MNNIPLEKFEKYLISKRLSEKTIREYLYYFIKFDYNEVNQENIANFISEKTNRNNVSRAFLKNLIRFMIVNYKEFELSYDERFELTLLELPKITGSKKKEIIDPLSLEEIYRLEANLTTEKLRLMLLINFFCGLRISELLRLRINDFYWEDWVKEIDKTIKLKIKGKRNKERIVYMKPDIARRLYKYIQRYCKDNPNQKIFFTGDITQDWIRSKGSIWNRELKKAALKAGINKDVHSHLLRHSIASYLLNVKKWDIKQIQVYLGHSSITSTQIYTHVSNEDLRESIEESL